jgi:subfamily B ATP-binding cassette protein MsbA
MSQPMTTASTRGHVMHKHTGDDSTRGLYGRLLRYLLPHKKLFAAAFSATLLFAALDALSFIVLIPFANRIFGDDKTLDFTRLGGDLGRLMGQTLGHFMPATLSLDQARNRMVIAILAVFIVKNIFDFIRTYLVVRLEQSVVRDLRNQVYSHLLELDLRFFNSTRAGDIIRRLTQDVDQVRSLLTNNFFSFLTAVLQVLISIGIMIRTDLRLTFVALIVLPAMFALWGRFLKRLKRGDRSVMELSGDITSHLSETVLAARQVRAAAAEKFESTRFAELVHRYFKAHIRTERVRALAAPLSEIVGAIGTVMLLWYGSRLIDAGTLTSAALLTFLTFSLKMYQPAKWLSRFPSLVNPGVISAERVFEFIDTPVEMVDAHGARPFNGVTRGIRFNGVSFHYNEGEPVLRDISFEVQPGQVVALVGPSGAGKTTLVDLVARFYDPTGGNITIDDVDLREYQAKSYRAGLGIVTQETVLFHDTVRGNIAYALPASTLDAVEAAARAANASDFIQRLPQGYATVLGERATRLSGGQRQRIAIARAILRDPPILIFDEATSALDSESERLVQEAIEHLLEGRTVFVIAHRLSTIRHADTILVMDQGRIVQRGTHDELLAEGGLYRKLHNLQFDSADDDLLEPAQQSR